VQWWIKQTNIYWAFLFK